MARFRMFNDSVKAMFFILWCDDHGIKVTSSKVYGTGAEQVNYIATDEQEATIPKCFRKA